MKANALFLTVVATLAAVPAVAQVSQSKEAIGRQIFGQKSGGAHACYRRVYDAAHLAGHPKQNVTTMLLLAARNPEEGDSYSYSLDIGVSFRGTGKRFEATGMCNLSGAGLGCGVDCDGGSIDVSMRDGRTILVKIPDGARLMAASEEASTRRGKFGEDDKVFRLERTKTTDCLPLVTNEKERAAIRRGN